jgi:hypothetical protein
LNPIDGPSTRLREDSISNTTLRDNLIAKTGSTDEKIQSVLAEVIQEVAVHFTHIGLGPEAVEGIFQVETVQTTGFYVEVNQLTILHVSHYQNKRRKPLTKPNGT